MAKKFTKLTIGDVVKTVGSRVFKKLITEQPKDDTIVGTWLFNEYINVNGGAWYAVDFISNGNFYVAMSDKRSQSSNVHDMSLKYFTTPTSYTTAFSGAGTWNNEAYRTIDITAEPTDEEFITWLKANATKQGAQEPSLPIWNGTDLTGTTWKFEGTLDGLLAETGVFNVMGTGQIILVVPDVMNGIFDITFTTLYLGYSSVDSGDVETMVPTDSKIGFIGNTSMPGYGSEDGYFTFATEYGGTTVTFTGGADATNATLISWLKQYGQLISHTMPTPTNTVQGKWLFNNAVTPLTWLNEYQTENVNFTSNGEHFTDIYWNSIYDPNDDVYCIYYADTLAVSGYYGNVSNWENEAYKTIEFDGEQEVSENFLAWLQANATQLSESGGTANITISFTIAGTSYQAEQGMTWAQWVESPYNTNSFSVQYDTVRIGSSAYHDYITYGNVRVTPTNSIISGGTYGTEAWSSGGSND